MSAVPCIIFHFRIIIPHSQTLRALTSNAIIFKALDAISDRFGGIIELLMSLNFTAMQAVIEKMRVQLDVHLNTLDQDVARIFQNALVRDPELIRNLLAPILVSEQLVYGLGYFYRPTEGSLALLARPDRETNSPLYVVRSDAEDDSTLVAERYFPEEVQRTEEITTIPSVRSYLPLFLPSEFPYWMPPVAIGDMVPNLDVNFYVIARWEEYKLPSGTNITETSNVEPDSGFLVSVLPLDVFHYVFKSISDNLPLTIILLETESLDLIATNVERITKKVSALKYKNLKVRDPVIYLRKQYDDFSKIPQELIVYSHAKNSTGTHIYVYHLTDPYEWTIVIVVGEELFETWDRVKLLMLGIAAALAVVASIPICLIGQGYIHMRDLVGEVHRKDALDDAAPYMGESAPPGEALDDSILGPGSSSGRHFDSIYPAHQ